MVNIRSAASSDTAVIVEIAVSSGLFTTEDVQVVEELMSDFGGAMRERGHRCVLAEDGQSPLGVAYYQPAPATSGTWDLTMIGIRNSHQGRGHGSALLAHVEDDLAKDGQRLLLVETSGVEAFAATRHFYELNGYAAVATVADYYEAGDDMVIFRKQLGSARF